MRNIDSFPESVWPEKRRKRVYFNSVLSRTEVDSSYLPARRLWQRMRNGHYLPNPALQLRVSGAHGEQSWQPVYQTLRLDLIERGNGRNWGWLGSAYRRLMADAGIAPQPQPPQVMD